jgi:hypothetical protein
MGACGLDPRKLSSQYNTKGTIPMNMVLDAKTLKVLEKWNGGSATTTEAKIKKYLGITTPAQAAHPNAVPPPSIDLFSVSSHTY